ncbi:FG-GAP repeat protein [Streptomyces sp. AN091965]|uniref:FG-GAP repeat protein n=1 Tax=Streptomyces sp. AN091965 TaxID=2927803 RepID=UPI001F60ABBB|nr:FG-GAP repeat protein [Streptomyces sp. AN091965]MCI3932719.1 VCBS repeat-containing protein [Streptomyces sp. AN091965]
MRALRTKVLMAVATAAVATGGLVVPLAGPAAAAPAAKDAADFNGDGYGDVVLATPDATVNGVKKAGHVAVLYGSADGVAGGRKQLLSQASAKVPGAPEERDGFGAAYDTGDLDGDGYADLVVGVPGENDQRGLITVLWGGRGGLVHGGLSMAPLRTDDVHYGGSVVVGDFDGDGRQHVATHSYWGAVSLSGDGFTRTRAPKQQRLNLHGDDAFRLVERLEAGDYDGDGDDDLLASGIANAEGDFLDGWVGYWKGGRTGVTFTRPPAALPATRTGLDGSGDVNKDGYEDVVITDKAAAKGGAVGVYYGGKRGPGSGGSTVLDQDSPGVPDEGEDGDAFGASASVGDVDGDGYADVAVGAPAEGVDGRTATGAVHLLKGSAAGLTATGAQVVDQGTPGVPGAAEDDDRFGSAVQVRDTDGDGRAEVVVAASGEDVFPGARWNDGSAWVLRGTKGGIGTAGAYALSERAFGLTYQNKRFGSVLGR